MGHFYLGRTVILIYVQYITYIKRHKISYENSHYYILIIIFHTWYNLYTTACSHTDCFTEDGTFTSANYPSDYESNTHDSWLITAPSGQTITINFKDFKTEEDAGCDSYDFVTLYDGDSRSDTEIGSYCDTDGPECQESSSNHLLVTFESDSTTEFRGFDVEFFVGG